MSKRRKDERKSTFRMMVMHIFVGKLAETPAHTRNVIPIPIPILICFFCIIHALHEVQRSKFYWRNLFAGYHFMNLRVHTHTHTLQHHRHHQYRYRHYRINKTTETHESK